MRILIFLCYAWLLLPTTTSASLVEGGKNQQVQLEILQQFLKITEGELRQKRLQFIKQTHNICGQQHQVANKIGCRLDLHSVLLKIQTIRLGISSIRLNIINKKVDVPSAIMEVYKNFQELKEITEFWFITYTPQQKIKTQRH